MEKYFSTIFKTSLKLKAVTFLFLWSFAMLYICWLSGIRHDYVFYLKIWNLMISGLDPWIFGNSYGPLHNTFAYLIGLSDLAPKFLFASSLLFANSLLLIEGIKRRSHDFSLTVYLTTIPFNVLVVGIGFRYGLNDGLIAFFMTCAVICRARNKNIATGVLVGLGGLMKFYPIILLPFIALSARRYKYSIVLTGITVFAIGMFCSYLVWGKGILNPIIFGVERGTGLLSIFASLNTVFKSNLFITELLKYNVLILLSAVTFAFVICLKKKSIG